MAPIGALTIMDGAWQLIGMMACWQLSGMDGMLTIGLDGACWYNMYLFISGVYTPGCCMVIIRPQQKSICYKLVEDAGGRQGL